MKMKFKTNTRRSLSSRMEHFPILAGLFLLCITDSLLRMSQTSVTHNATSSFQVVLPREGVPGGRCPTSQISKPHARPSGWLDRNNTLWQPNGEAHGGTCRDTPWPSHQTFTGAQEMHFCCVICSADDVCVTT